MYPEYLETEASLDEFLAAFEQGTYPKEKWTHGAHVVMAASYILTESAEGLIDRTRERIRNYNLCQGGQNTDDSGYHETLTVFWLGVIRQYLDASPKDRPRLHAVRDAFMEFGRRSSLWREYYGFNVIQSGEARRRWLAPDSGYFDSRWME